MWKYNASCNDISYLFFGVPVREEGTRGMQGVEPLYRRDAERGIERVHQPGGARGGLRSVFAGQLLLQRGALPATGGQRGVRAQNVARPQQHGSATRPHVSDEKLKDDKRNITIRIGAKNDGMQSTCMHSYLVDVGSHVPGYLQELRVAVLRELKIRVVAHDSDAVIPAKLNHVLIAAKWRVTHLLNE